MHRRRRSWLRALRAAFPQTIPILTSFCFLGLTYGVYMHSAGFSFLYPMFMSLTVFGGSLEFLLVSLLVGQFNPVQTILMAFMLQARHLFYGIAMLEQYRSAGWRRLYLIFGMCDETFSINCSAKIPEDVEPKDFYLCVTLLNHAYWVVSATVGGIVGSMLKFDTSGIDFAMTAMFVVILLERLLQEKVHISAIIGLFASVACLLIFGAEAFLLPSMALILVLLTVFRKPIEKAGEDA